MSYEEKYNELREALKVAFETYYNHPTPANKAEWKYAEQEFSNFCVICLEHLMEENADVLRRMKMEEW